MRYHVRVTDLLVLAVFCSLGNCPKTGSTHAVPEFEEHPGALRYSGIAKIDQNIILSERATCEVVSKLKMLQKLFHAIAG